MTSMPAAPTGAPGAGPVPGKVFRTELNPVEFLHRAAYIYPDKTAVVSGSQRYSYRQLAERSWRLANALRSAGTPKCASSIAGELNSSVATRSALPRPADRSALASRQDRSASCR